MSLSARIAVRASHRLEGIAAIFALSGVAVATITAGRRWPEQAWAFVALAIVAATVVVRSGARRARAAVGYTLSVSDRADIAVDPDAESGDGESWRLDASTMMWPGFSVIGLRRGSDAVHGSRSMRLASFDVESSELDRRALHRFLLWSLRGGSGKDAPTNASR